MRTQGRLRRLLVGFQVALSVSVLVVAGLLVRGVIRGDARTGIRPGPVLLMTIAPNAAGCANRA